MASTQNIDSSQPFRFLDLPPEIRNRVISHALPGNDNINSRRVANFQFPALTRVSRQIRQESLPILFADTNFVFNVGTNAIPYAQVPGIEDRSRVHRQKSGTLGFKPVVQRFLKDAGESAIFRDVTFDVNDAPMVSAVRHVSLDRVYQFVTIVELRLTVEHGRVDFVAVDGDAHPRGESRSDSAQRTKNVDDAVERVRGIVEEVAARSGFKGFTMKDLRRIAKGFRVEVE